MNTERCSSIGRFSAEKLHTRIPLHLLHARKISQFESKALFFEGQLDPLNSENLSLKEQLIFLTKMVASSTDLLRNLLPTSNHPTRKLKLQLANITQISQMIKQDWLRMEEKIAEDAETICQLTTERDQWHNSYDQQCALRINQIKDLEELKEKIKVQLEQSIASLRNQILLIEKRHEQEKEGLKADFNRKMMLFEFSVKQYEIFKYETKKKQQNYEKAIERLKGEIQANLVSFQQSKKNLKEIYDKLMADKLAEQAEGYDLMLKAKEDEKFSLLLQMNELEEEQKRKIAQKQYEITKLTDLKNICQEEIGGLKGQIWNKQLQIDKQLAFERELESKIETLTSMTKSLSTKLEAQKEEMIKQKIQFELQLRKQQQELELIKKQGNQALNTLLEQKKKIEDNLAETTNKYKQTMSTLAKAEAQFNSKLTKLKEQWEKNEQTLKEAIAEGQKLIQDRQRSLELSQLARQELIKQYEQNFKLMETQFKNKQTQLAQRYEYKLSFLEEQMAAKLSDQQKKYQDILREAKIAANDEIRETLIEFNKKLTLQASQYLQLIDKAKQEEQAVQNMLAQAKDKIRQQEDEKRKQEEEKEELKIQHLKEMRLLQEQNQLEKQKLNQEMDKQMMEFQRSLEEKEAQISNIKACMQNQIKMLKEANSIDTIQQYYQGQINKLKMAFNEKEDQLKAEFDQHLQCLQTNKQSLIDKLKEQHKHNLEQVQQSYNQDLSKLAQKTQEEDTFLQERLLGSTGDNFEHMTPEEKKQYIAKKISQLKSSVVEKDQEIDKLSAELKDIQANIEKRVKARRDELQLQKEIAIKDCQHRITKATAECTARVTAVEQERIQHTRIMRQEFQLMRMSHERQMKLLKLKYNELQVLFQQRPSRVEDLTKIKELINLQSKMDIQIQSYQKRMETANQIVKYLNLELQNYKDAYDIFGPNSENKEIGIIGHAAFRQHYTHQTILEPLTAEVSKNYKHERKDSQSKKTEDNQASTKQPLSFRKWNDSPPVKQLKLFQNDSEEDLSLEPRVVPESTSNAKIRRYSNLILQKPPQKRQRIKTEKNQKMDNEAEIMMNAEHFLRLIKNGQLSNPVIREEEQIARRKGYRKRKFNKKNTTIGTEHYI